MGCDIHLRLERKAKGQSLVEILHDAAVRQLDGINNEIAQL